GERCRGERRSPATNPANQRMPTKFVTTPPAKPTKQQFAKIRANPRTIKNPSVKISVICGQTHDPTGQRR
ncbi:hypothetical protein, partial [Prosthecochloris ethylica]|uniref:hypothetical protein n=1 Tax=Prosthecochloris ethylica TaxID=2743976 RepID=UPI001A925886